VDSRQFQRSSLRGHLPTEILHGLQISALDVPSIRWPLDRGEVGGARQGATAQLDAKHPLSLGAGALAENAEAIVRKHALHDQLALLQLLPRDEITCRPLLRSPDDRHGLKVLRANRGKELFDSPTRRRSAGERAASFGAARGKDRNERESQALHGESPVVR
jgi:hypothetical protein